MQRVGAAIGEGARTVYSSSMSMSPRIAFSTSSSSFSTTSSSFSFSPSPSFFSCSACSSSVSSYSSSSFSFSASSSLSSPFLTADLTSQESRARCLAKIAKMKPLRPADGPVVNHELNGCIFV